MKTKECLDELEQITKPLLLWLKEHCNQYESVIVGGDEVKVISVEAGIPL